uniref:Uncharacterized protein n=1 Tax=Amphimedon queenslandica TaxID=400682 RepID=A0A1X7V086_AMPQE
SPSPTTSSSTSSMTTSKNSTHINTFHTSNSSEIYATSTITIESTASTSITTFLNISTSPVMSTPVSTSKSTGNNTLILGGAISSFTVLFLLLVVTIVIVSVFVCRRSWKTTNTNHTISASKCAAEKITDQQSRDAKVDNTLSYISTNPAYGVIGGKSSCNTDVSINPAYGMVTGRRYESIAEFAYDEPRTMNHTEVQD